VFNENLSQPAGFGYLHVMALRGSSNEVNALSRNAHAPPSNIK
jgi:hypothetical protein